MKIDKICSKSNHQDLFSGAFRNFQTFIFISWQFKQGFPNRDAPFLFIFGASAGNRTRAARVACEHSTSEPDVPKMKRNIQIENQILMHMVQQKKPVLRLKSFNKRNIYNIYKIFWHRFELKIKLFNISIQINISSNQRESATSLPRSKLKTKLNLKSELWRERA